MSDRPRPPSTASASSSSARSSPDRSPGQLLGDLGADVVKVEPPGTGDPMRRWGVLDGGRSLWWPAIARNKRSVAVDLRDERGRDVVRRLAAHVDVVLENFKPGTLERWGLGYDALAAANPAVVLVHVSGYGQTGPRAHEPGLRGDRRGGRAASASPPASPTGRPARAGISLGDSLAALFAVDRHARPRCTSGTRSGKGQEVDVAIAEAVFALMESTVADFELGGVVRTRSGGVLQGVAPSNAYPTADGRDVVIAANADAVFARLCDAMGRPELATDPRYAEHEARGARQAELDDEIAAWTAQLPADDLLARPRAALGAVRADPRRARPRGRSPVRGPRDGAAPRGGLRPSGPDGRRRAEALAHARRGAHRRARARRAHRRGPARARRASTGRGRSADARVPHGVDRLTRRSASGGGRGRARGRRRRASSSSRRLLGDEQLRRLGAVGVGELATVVVQNSTMIPFGSVDVDRRAPAVVDLDDGLAVVEPALALRRARSSSVGASNAMWFVHAGQAEPAADRRVEVGRSRCRRGCPRTRSAHRGAVS